MTTRSVTVSIRVSPDELARMDAYATARFGGNRTQAIIHAVGAAADMERLTPPGLASDTWDALQAGAKRRLRRALTERELALALVITRSWWVTGADAAMINVEASEYALDVLDPDPEGEAGRAFAALFGPRVKPHELGVYGPAFAAKLHAMPELDRAVLTVACREWWAAAEPRPPVSAILGGPLRDGERMN